MMLGASIGGVRSTSVLPRPVPSLNAVSMRGMPTRLQPRALPAAPGVRCDSGAAVQKKRQSSRKAKVPPLPQPQGQQQTLLRSFTLGGIGLHTGEYAFVRVRPAFAGEGRYFVRVPPGTNADNYELMTPQYIDQAALNGAPEDGLDEDERTRMFLQFMAEQHNGFEGTFGDYVRGEIGAVGDKFFTDEAANAGPEEPVALAAGEDYLPASLTAANVHRDVCLALETPTLRVLSPESLLCALEACGVDNARIEIEGGDEVPVIDGTATGWAIEIQKAGLREAVRPSGRPAEPRVAPAPEEMLTVRDGDSFVSFYPGSTPRVTAGVQHDVFVIGKQWYTWGPGDAQDVGASVAERPDLHFRWEVAPARMVLPSVAAVEQLMESGLLQAGPENCCLVADGQDWIDPMLLHFPADEAARHAVATLLGVMALAAQPGGRGLPEGHVVAYRASPKLLLKFANALQIAAAEWTYAPVAL